MPFHWPLHNYLGPGTSEFTESPVDTDDCIAREHDLDYEFAVSNEEIHLADSRAVEKFWQDFKNTGNIHSLVGSISLGIKYCTEGLFSTSLYPKLNVSTIDKAIYMLREKYLTDYAKEHKISFQEAQENQRDILNNNPDYQADLKKLICSFDTSNKNVRDGDINIGLRIPLEFSKEGPHNSYKTSDKAPNKIVNMEDYYNNENIFE